jgi:hypothetical protein
MYRDEEKDDTTEPREPVMEGYDPTINASRNERDKVKAMRGASKRRSSEKLESINENEDDAPSKVKRGEKVGNRTISSNYKANLKYEEDEPFDDRSMSLMTTDSLDPPSVPPVRLPHQYQPNINVQQHEQAQHTYQHPYQHPHQQQRLNQQNQQQQVQHQPHHQQRFLDTVSHSQQNYSSYHLHQQEQDHNNTSLSTSINTHDSDHHSMAPCYPIRHLQSLNHAQSGIQVNHPLSPFTHDRIFNSINTFMAGTMFETLLSLL